MSEPDAGRVARNGGVRALPWIVAAGLSIGWLTGLSASPVLASVLAGVVGVLGGAVAIIGSEKRNAVSAENERRERTDWSEQLRAAAMLIVAIAVAAPVGIIVRTHCWLEPGMMCSQNRSGQPQSGGALFTASSETCAELQAMPADLLARALKTDEFPFGSSLANAIEDPQILKRVVDRICSET